MSKSIRKSKDPSREYWSCRPFNNCGGIVGAFTKRRTHKAERQMGKKATGDI